MSDAVELGVIAAAAGVDFPAEYAFVQVSSVEIAASEVLPGCLFAALPGRNVHGAAFIAEAMSRGAVAVLTDADGARMASELSIPTIVVSDPRAAVGVVSACVYRTQPADLEHMLLFAVTGTNGKTTVNAMLDAGLRACGLSTAIVGTTGTVIAGVHLANSRTTPEAPHIHALLRRMLDAGVQAACFEVSSIALDECRVDALQFSVAGFTNLTQDHLDYHGTMESYFLSKSALFTPEHASRGVIGIDDDYGVRLAATTEIPVQTWSVSDPQASWSLRGSEAVGPNVVVGLKTRLPGAHNMANALLAMGMLQSAGLDPHLAAIGIAEAVVPGRMEVVSTSPIRCIVDYAHSPDAVTVVLSALRESTSGRLIAVVGAGGDRDRQKRPLMGEAAARLADIVIVTDDNPRSEDAAVIRAQVLAGASESTSGAQILEVADRAEAIVSAVRHATSGDTVVVLGKGHETGQEIAGVTHPFDDREVLASAAARRQP